jgi:hypothetical protein
MGTTMTQDEIIAMAREAHRKLVTEYYVGHHGQIDAWTMLLLERFAKLVAAHEREACAKVVEEPWMGHPKEIARAIRNRGQQ